MSPLPIAADQGNGPSGRPSCRLAWRGPGTVLPPVHKCSAAGELRRLPGSAGGTARQPADPRAARHPHRPGSVRPASRAMPATSDFW